MVKQANPVDQTALKSLPERVSPAYIMSASPPEKADVDQAPQSEGEQDNNKEMEGEGGAQGLGDFEVKEQDRWLPIANGMLHVTLLCAIVWQSCKLSRRVYNFLCGFPRIHVALNTRRFVNGLYDDGPATQTKQIFLNHVILSHTRSCGYIPIAPVVTFLEP